MKVPVKFPESVELLISSGQKVDFTTPFFRKKTKKSIKIPLSDILKFKPEKIFMSLKKVIGDAVKKGDLLAENQSFLSSKQYFSSVDGTIKEIDHLTGTLTVELETGKDHIIACFFTGEVETIGDDYLELKVTKAHKFDTTETPHYVGAPVFYISGAENTVTEDNVADRCICAVEINPLDHAKIETFGAKAFITSATTPKISNLDHIVLQNHEDFENVLKEQYPFCIMGVDSKSIYFYK